MSLFWGHNNSECLYQPVLCCCVLQCRRTLTYSHMHARKSTAHTYNVWNDQVSNSVLVLLSGWEQQCSVDASRQNSTMSPHQRVRQTVSARFFFFLKKKDAQCAPQSWKNPDRQRGMKGRSCVLLLNISRGAAHIVPYPLQQLLRLKSCSASNYDCIPENRQKNSIPVLFVFPWYSCHESHTSRSRIETLKRVLGEGGDNNVPTPDMRNGAETGKQCCRCFSSISINSSSIQQPPLPSFTG